MGCKTNLLNLLSNLWSLITEKNFQKLVALEMLRSLCTPASHSCFFQSGRHRLGVDFLFLFGEAKRKMNESLEKKRICKSFLSCFYARRYLQLVKTGLKGRLLWTVFWQHFDNPSTGSGWHSETSGRHSGTSGRHSGTSGRHSETSGRHRKHHDQIRMTPWYYFLTETQTR